MVLLLGACPEYGCLVYEYLSNGSLEDRLLHRGNLKPLSWQHRFRIAAEIGTGLLFLHQTKPEPLVHRDLKPGNILLDRNFVSKISDVGLWLLNMKLFQKSSQVTILLLQSCFKLNVYPYLWNFGLSVYKSITNNDNTLASKIYNNIYTDVSKSDLHTHKYINNAHFLISLTFLDYRFKSKDIPGSVSKGIPDFCTIYVISKGKISTTRAASRSAPFISPVRSQILLQPSTRSESEISIPNSYISNAIPKPPAEQTSQRLPSDSGFKRQVQIIQKDG
ncbi:hypothetical protein POM88_013756 [Heracleum sosnowskyi]|uniref:RING-type E3 ubiquitin transferase n=1 Tax=Heracleum sosnowskyi TaxID=360622 RepID=A0AAD8IZ58_9APIA|nr:hypothetical protein POM88_013756 [Heracleum sosnowskyi]